MSRKSKRDPLLETYLNHVPDMRASINQVNQETIRQYYLRLIGEWSQVRFKWTLPDTIDPRFLERELFYRGIAVFYRDWRYGDRFMAVRAATKSIPNVYDNPTEFKTLSINRYSGVDLRIRSYVNPQESGRDVCVPIWSNISRRPDLDVVRIFAEKLAYIDMSIQIASRNLRNSKVILAPEGQRLTASNLMARIEQGDQIIFATDELDLEMFTSLQVGADPDSLGALRTERDNTWNDCMSALGIENANQNKKERMIVQEVGSNSDQLNSARAVALQARKWACDEINAIWPDAGVSVEWNTDYRPDNDRNGDGNYDEWEDNDGDVHDGTADSE